MDIFPPALGIDQPQLLVEDVLSPIFPLTPFLRPRPTVSRREHQPVPGVRPHLHDLPAALLLPAAQQRER